MHYNRLLLHVGHEIEIVTYGEIDQPPHNVSVECMTCMEVLFDLDNPYSGVCDQCHTDMQVNRPDYEQPYWFCPTCGETQGRGSD